MAEEIGRRKGGGEEVATGETEIVHLDRVGRRGCSLAASRAHAHIDRRLSSRIVNEIGRRGLAARQIPHRPGQPAGVRSARPGWSRHRTADRTVLPARSFVMDLKFWKRGLSARATAGSRSWPKSFRPCLEQLMDRVVPAVSFSFSAGQLTIVSDDAADSIAVTND